MLPGQDALRLEQATRSALCPGIDAFMWPDDEHDANTLDREYNVNGSMCSRTLEVEFQRPGALQTLTQCVAEFGVLFELPDDSHCVGSEPAQTLQIFSACLVN